MESLEDRFDALQENLLQLYEAGSDNIKDQILYWDIVRQENVLLHYARKKGLNRIGLQVIPTLIVSENKAKQAILMTLQLRSLQKSAFGSESWTLQDTSYEAYTSAPENTFKKGGFTVDVFYDNDEDNYYPYTAWSYIYYQNGDDIWYKVPGQVDYEGLFYETHDGEKQYYVTFDKDAARFSRTGMWTVKYKNHTISSTSITSTSGHPGHSPPREQSTNSLARETEASEAGRRQRSSESDPRRSGPLATQSDRATSPETSRRRVQRRRRRGEREPAAKRREQRAARGGLSSAPSPEEVGKRHRLVEGKGLPRLRRLQEEARDPPLVLLKGPGNTLKCWRFKCKQKYCGLYHRISTNFSWVGEGSARLGTPRMLIAFTSPTQRQAFLRSVVFPKGTEFSLGNLYSL
ncbi:E2 [Human papillomavirus 170]|uniref:Regulatory protein E2 n=1 Tax=Human papillomavirus 170 TaxID=1315265 RepID=K4MNI4_9PAPI|nr:E2 [Human papillomavirus 170]